MKEARPRPIGLVKFFGERRYLDDLMNGVLYCNSPEYYRRLERPGAGDRVESCVMSYRRDRDGDEISLTVNDIELGPVLEAATLYDGGHYDRWLHCWMVLEAPDDEEGLLRLASDVNRVRTEFGSDYLFLPIDHIQQFLDRVRGSVEHELATFRVSYSENRGDWSSAVKPLFFHYQREFRLALGRCTHTSMEPLQRSIEGGFADLLIDSPDIALRDQQSNHCWFELSRDGAVANVENDASS